MLDVEEGLVLVEKGTTEEVAAEANEETGSVENTGELELDSTQVLTALEGVYQTVVVATTLPEPDSKAAVLELLGLSLATSRALFAVSLLLFTECNPAGDDGDDEGVDDNFSSTNC